MSSIESNTGFSFDIAKAVAPPAPSPRASTPISSNRRGGDNGLCQGRGRIEYRKLNLVLLAHGIAQLRSLELLQHLAVPRPQHVVVARQLGEFGFDLGHGLHCAVAFRRCGARDRRSALAMRPGPRPPGCAARGSARRPGWPPGCRPPGCPSRPWPSIPRGASRATAPATPAAQSLPDASACRRAGVPRVAIRNHGSGNRGRCHSRAGSRQDVALTASLGTYCRSAASWVVNCWRRLSRMLSCERRFCNSVISTCRLST